MSVRVNLAIGSTGVATLILGRVPAVGESVAVDAKKGPV
jgi:hypothetical protein